MRELQGLMKLTAEAEVRVGEAESHEVIHWGGRVNLGFQRWSCT